MMKPGSGASWTQRRMLGAAVFGPGTVVQVAPRRFAVIGGVDGTTRLFVVRRSFVVHAIDAGLLRRVSLSADDAPEWEPTNDGASLAVRCWA